MLLFIIWVMAISLLALLSYVTEGKPIEALFIGLMIFWAIFTLFAVFRFFMENPTMYGLVS